MSGGLQERTVETRNLVLCLDGTSNEFCGKNTNVIKLFNMLQADRKQLLYYDSGIGSWPAENSGEEKSWFETFDQGWDMAFASGFPLHVKAAYQWLSDYYDENDNIYMFGFSRGAYTARVLAGMVETVGLIPKGNHSQVSLAWQTFCNTRITKKNRQAAVNLAAAYKSTFSRTLRSGITIRFIGVWDTVASLGLSRADMAADDPFAKYDSVTYFRQALSLDERRVMFQPILYREEENTKGGQQGVAKLERWKEAWFCGSHCDVGGGYVEDEDPALSDIPLRWMMREALECEVKIAGTKVIESPVYTKWDIPYNTQGNMDSCSKAAAMIREAATWDDQGRVFSDTLKSSLMVNDSLTWRWSPAEVRHWGRARDLQTITQHQQKAMGRLWLAKDSREVTLHPSVASYRKANINYEPLLKWADKEADLLVLDREYDVDKIRAKKARS